MAKQCFRDREFSFCFCLLLKRKKGLIKDALLLHTYILLQFIARTFGTDSLAKPLSKALIRDLLKLDPTALKGSFHLCLRKSKVEKREGTSRMCT